MPRLSSPERPLRVGLVAGDLAVAALAGLAAVAIRFNPSNGAAMLRELGGNPAFLALMGCSIVVAAATCDLYHPEFWRTGERLLVRLLGVAVVLSVVVMVGVYLVPAWRFGRGLLTLSLVMTVGGMGAARLVVIRTLRRTNGPAAVLVGSGPLTRRLMGELEGRPSPPFRIVGEVGPEELLAGGVDAPYVLVDGRAASQVLDRLAVLNFQGRSVIDVSTAYAELTGRVPVDGTDPRWFLTSGDFASLATSHWHTVQRVVDSVLALVLLVLGSPLLAVGALAVLVTSGRPVFYTQERLGLHRRPFRLLKLRTMRRDAERDGARFAARRDDRVLKVGRVLRRWRIDEVPQLLHVLSGRMNLVGPRPERPEVAEELERKWPFYAFRYSVRPGLTGWAQVNLPYCEDDEDHLAKLEYDLFYLRNLGPAMELLVLIRTFGALIFRPGR